MSATTVYLMRDAKGEPIYVGITAHIARRMNLHEHQSPWISEVASIETLPCANRSDALEMEGCIAAAYRPRHNVNLVPGRRAERGMRRATRPTKAAS